MSLPYELNIGLRYTRAKRRNGFISFISFISIAGIAIGVWALITVISVMNGFESEFRNRILGMTSHATISQYRAPLKDWPHVVKESQKNEHVLGAAPYVEGQLMLSNAGAVSGAIARGILPKYENEVSMLKDKMIAGNISVLDKPSWNIIIGKELANRLRLFVGDKVTVITPKSNITVAGFMPRLKTFTVAGIFELGMQEYDSAFVFLNAEDAAKLLQMPKGSVSGVRLKLDDMFKARKTAETVAETLGGAYWVSDWTRRHANLFSAIKTERNVMSIILGLIVLVAAFNIISTLVMVVTDKQADIAILRTLGASPKSIMLIFLVQGVMIGVVGTVIGVLAGSLSGAFIGDVIAWVENIFEFKFISADVYYISDLPSELRWGNVLFAGLLSLVISFLITLYPAYRASKVQPAEALRYE